MIISYLKEVDRVVSRFFIVCRFICTILDHNMNEFWTKKQAGALRKGYTQREAMIRPGNINIRRYAYSVWKPDHRQIHCASLSGLGGLLRYWGFGMELPEQLLFLGKVSFYPFHQQLERNIFAGCDGLRFHKIITIVCWNLQLFRLVVYFLRVTINQSTQSALCFL